MPTETQLAHRKQWLDALRSGRYQQCNRRLVDRENNSFCCLGVAADLDGKLNASGNFELNGDVYSVLMPLDTWFADRFGIDNPPIDNAVWGDESHAYRFLRQAACYNDQWGMGFVGIAENLERDFADVDAGKYDFKSNLARPPSVGQTP